jgi:hypothetical protein
MAPRKGIPIVLNPDTLIDTPHPWRLDTRRFSEILAILWYRVVLKLNATETARRLYLEGKPNTLIQRISQGLSEGRRAIQSRGQIDLGAYHPIIGEIENAVLGVPRGNTKIVGKPLAPSEQKRLVSLETEYRQSQGQPPPQPLPTLKVRRKRSPKKPPDLASLPKDGTPVPADLEKLADLLIGSAGSNAGEEPEDEDPEESLQQDGVQPLRYAAGIGPTIPDKCSRCSGTTLIPGRDWYGEYATCLQCGCVHEAISDPPIDLLEELETGHRQRRRQPSHGKIRL